MHLTSLTSEVAAKEKSSSYNNNKSGFSFYEYNQIWGTKLTFHGQTQKKGQDSCEKSYSFFQRIDQESWESFAEIFFQEIIYIVRNKMGKNGP